MTYKDSDYTIVIAVVHCFQIIIVEVKLTLVVKLCSNNFLSSLWPLLLIQLKPYGMVAM